MGLPWVRLDANIATHDKTLAAVSIRGGKAAMAVYQFALAWSGGQGTDGHIPYAALPMIHGTKQDAAILCMVGLWEQNGSGWNIHNFGERQELRAVSEALTHAARVRSLKANCIRWHGPDCGCWKDAT